MPLLKQDLTDGGIYIEARGTLASRIDFAWEIYQDDANADIEKREALKFLIYAFDISDIINVNAQLIQLMAERKQYKITNPEFIPEKSPSRIPFDPKTVIPKATRRHGETDSPEIKAAIQAKELLDVINDGKDSDWERNTTFLTTEERAARRVNISGGSFKKDGIPFDTSGMHSHGKMGFAAYTLNVNGELSVFTHNQRRDGFAHSSMNAGRPVVAAGEIIIENGVLKLLLPIVGIINPHCLMSPAR